MTWMDLIETEVIPKLYERATTTDVGKHIKTLHDIIEQVRYQGTRHVPVTYI